MQLFHDDVVLEIRVPPEVKTNPVAQFSILDSFDLRNAKEIYFRQDNEWCTVGIRSRVEIVHTKLFLPQDQSCNWEHLRQSRLCELRDEGGLVTDASRVKKIMSSIQPFKHNVETENALLSLSKGYSCHPEPRDGFGDGAALI